MAAKGLDIDQEAFCCPICLDLLKDPVTIQCGHSYCMSCVNTHWDGEVGKSYSCPQCRQNFTQRPVLVKNTMLSILMEGLRKSGPPAAQVSPSSAANGDVSCDLCSGRKVKAVKSCLQCLVSYCKEHLQPHYDVPALKRHKLVEPTENLQQNICPRHDEVMKMFCRTDQLCICYLCSLDQHKGHHTVTAAAVRAEKQRELQAVQQNVLQRIHHKETSEEQLQQQVKNSRRSADAAVEHSDRSLKELLRLLEKRMSEVKQQVRSQQEAEEHRVKELQDKVQQEITELRRKLTELDTLSHTEDHVQFLHKFASLSKVSETSDSVKSSQTPPPFQDTVTAAVSKLRSALQETSLRDPPAEVHKPKVNPPKTDAPPAGVHRAAPPKQTSQREVRTVTLPPQSLQPQPFQADVPAPLQNSENSSLLDFAAAVHKLKLNNPQTDDHPEGIQLTLPPESCSHEEWWNYLMQNLEQFPLGFFPSRSYPAHQRPPPPPQDMEEWPALPHHNMKRKITPAPNPQPSPAPNPQPSPAPNPQPSPAPNPQPSPAPNPQPSPAPNPQPSPSLSSKEGNYLKMKKYARKLTWDPRSMNDKLELSNENLTVKRMAQSQGLRPHVFRFTQLPQVVSKETLNGQCYFEVSVYTHYSKSVTLGVAYKDMKREGSSNEVRFGMNNKSWAFEFFRDICVIWHNGCSVEIPMGNGTLMGVFVDYRAGILSFYREMNLVYTFNTTFTRPLVAGMLLENVEAKGTISRRMILDTKN